MAREGNIFSVYVPKKMMEFKQRNQEERNQTINPNGQSETLVFHTEFSHVLTAAAVLSGGFQLLKMYNKSPLFPNYL